MRFSSWSLWAVILMASIPVAAQESDKKPAAAPSQSKAAQPKEPSEDSDQAEPSDEKPEAPADEKPAKKSPKKGIGLKVVADEDDQADVVRKLSYMQGFGMGKQLFEQFTQRGVELDEELFLTALKDGLAGKEPTMSEEEMKSAVTSIQKYLTERYAARAKEEGAKNKEEGAVFLAENKRKEGIKTLPSGLQYKVIKSGKGETPKKTDTIKMHYKGAFAATGKEFESSYKNGTPVTLPMANLVKGMSEGLQMMKVGDKWQLFLPSSLGYGEQGNPVIPPNAVLMFEVELLGIEKGGKGPSGLPPLQVK